MKVKVIRAFLVKGQAQPVGSEVELDDRFALEMLHVGKVQRAGDKPAGKRAGPMTTPASGLVAGAPKKEDAP